MPQAEIKVEANSQIFSGLQLLITSKTSIINVPLLITEYNLQLNINCQDSKVIGDADFLVKFPKLQIKRAASISIILN